MRLIVVESPTKARTLNRFLGKDYIVEATMGHIKDLPKSPISVDIENNFEPDYKSLPKQKKTISTLKKAAKSADEIYLATDPDREGEAISAHVNELFKDSKISDSKIKRIEFHEITQEAVEHAIDNPRKIDDHLVDAQTSRRVLDRIVGYKLSPILWKKIRRGLSAGRVQSVAVRLIVEREREIEAFKPEEYWEIGSLFKEGFLASLVKIDGKKAEINTKEDADKVVSDLNKVAYQVSEIKRKEHHTRPYGPFTTSTMTQAAANLMGWSAKKTMTVAQKLYEEGLITYHRTDSTNVAKSAQDKVLKYISEKYGKSYIPEHPRLYKTKSKGAQEAHEAIRPTGLNPESDNADPGLQKLYDLIFRRFVASQMADAVYDATTIDVSAGKYLLRANGKIMKFDGWRKVLPLKSDEDVILPELAESQKLNLEKVQAEQKFTLPPARYNEASLIKTLEKMGIGRPSTYAPIISTIQYRNYVEKDEGRFKATAIGITVNDFLVEHFSTIVDYEFTADMENHLDEVAEGKLDWHKEMKEFWDPFSKILKDVEEKSARVKIEVEKLGEPCPECKEGEKVIRVGRFGKFISCSRFPDCKYTEKYQEKIDMKCPNCEQGDVIVKKTKRGRTFFGCSRYPECDWASWTDPREKKEEKGESSEEVETDL